MTVHDPLDEVRAACRSVAEHSQHVHINLDLISTYATALPLERIRHPEHDPRSHYLGHGDDTATFFIVLDSINFGSGYFPHLSKRPGMSGYFTIASSLNDYFREHGTIAASELMALDTATCTRLFGQNPDNQPIQDLMELFTHALNDLGRFITERYRGSFTAMVEDSARSAARLVSILTGMPFFRDVEEYLGFRVPFYKRAQLMASDLALAFNGAGLGQYDDLSRLTIFADNLVPHVLRMDGVLSYSERLAEQIDHELLVPAGSEEEVEIRACALHAVELISADLARHGSDTSPMMLDYLLWNRGQEPFYKQTRPRHRTRTVFY